MFLLTLLKDQQPLIIIDDHSFNQSLAEDAYRYLFAFPKSFGGELSTVNIPHLLIRADTVIAPDEGLNLVGIKSLSS